MPPRLRLHVHDLGGNRVCADVELPQNATAQRLKEVVGAVDDTPLELVSLIGPDGERIRDDPMATAPALGHFSSGLSHFGSGLMTEPPKLTSLSRSQKIDAF